MTKDHKDLATTAQDTADPWSYPLHTDCFAGI